MHLDQEATQRLLHGELAPPAERSLRAHLAACADCRSRLAEAAREETFVFGLLRQLDHPAPDVDPARIAGAADRGRRPAPGRATDGPAGARRWGRWAAGVVLAAGVAGAAYAAPGSPLRRLVRAIGRGAAPAIGDPAPAAARAARAAPAAPAPEPGDAGGLTVLPGPRLAILFARGQPGGSAVVTITDDAEVVVRALRGAARFTAGTDRLVVETDDASAGVEIRIPRAAPHVEIRVGGRLVFRKDGPRIRTDAERDARGAYLVSLAPPGA